MCNCCTLVQVSKHYEGVPLLAVEKYVELCSVCRENPVTMETNIEKSVDKPKHVGKNNCFMKKGQVRSNERHFVVTLYIVNCIM